MVVLNALLRVAELVVLVLCCVAPVFSVTTFLHLLWFQSPVLLEFLPFLILSIGIAKWALSRLQLVR
jgi:hypothetical protein